MKRETRYIAILLFVVALFVVVQLVAPKPVNWIPTYDPNDKNPFGAYVVKDLMGRLFPAQAIDVNNLTIYELQHSIDTGANFFSLSTKFEPDRESVKVLLNKVDSGAHAFLSAYYCYDVFADTLNLHVRDILSEELAQAVNLNDTVSLKFLNRQWEKTNYYYKLENVTNYFTHLDSIRYPVAVIATNDWNYPVTIKISIGRGYLILNSTPLAFTNNYVLTSRNHEFLEKTFSYLPVAPVVWTNYYQTGRQEPQTPLRYILSQEPLRWAYYLLIGGVLCYVLIEAKRRQRYIPIIRPLRNSTLEFVRTIGNMYWQARDYKAVADKKILYFMERVRTHFFLASESPDTFAQALASKSGNSLEETEHLMALIHVIQSAPVVTPQMLTDLNHRMEKFKF